MDGHEPRTLVAVRTADNSGMDGSAEGRCSQCREPVWLSPASQQMLASEVGIGMTVTCLVCTKGEIARMSPEEVEQVTARPVSRKEVLDELRKRQNGR
jgi:hypothetical protein